MMRTFLRRTILTMLLASLAHAAPAWGSELRNPHGTTRGLGSENPQWSVGAQVGNYGSTGVVAQKSDFYEGALNLGLGLAYGSFAVHADYVLLLTEDFRRLAIPDKGGYNAFRGHLNPYVGGGVQVGRGFSLRVPVGLQYGMVKDPFNFYGGLVLMLGRFLADEDFAAQLWFNVGARVLL